MSVPNRHQRAAIARETLAIVAAGWYRTADALRVDIAAATAACVEGTRLFAPDDIRALPSFDRGGNPGCATRIGVRDESTLAAAERMVDEGFERVGVLNFASARSPGGGFEQGSQAQEESLARSSSLHASLTSPVAKPYYARHREEATAAYSDRVIVSPDCPVFRDDDGNLRKSPFHATFLTCAAPNARDMAGRQPEAVPSLPAIFERRIAAVLAAALDSGCEALVLGAWGCGVFGNAPAMVADAFAAHLGAEGGFHQRFRCIEFAVLDNSPGKECLASFEQAFGRHLP